MTKERENPQHDSANIYHEIYAPSIHIISKWNRWKNTCFESMQLFFARVSFSCLEWWTIYFFENIIMMDASKMINLHVCLPRLWKKRYIIFFIEIISPGGGRERERKTKEKSNKDGIWIVFNDQWKIRGRDTYDGQAIKYSRFDWIHKLKHELYFKNISRKSRHFSIWSENE